MFLPMTIAQYFAKDGDASARQVMGSDRTAKRSVFTHIEHYRVCSGRRVYIHLHSTAGKSPAICRISQAAECLHSRHQTWKGNSRLYRYSDHSCHTSGIYLPWSYHRAAGSGCSVWYKPGVCNFLRRYILAYPRRGGSRYAATDRKSLADAQV